MKPIAIVLGGTVPHVQLIEKLKARGYYVVLADYLDDPPARLVADEHVKVSTLDKSAVLELARDRSAGLVISTCVDQANVTCCYVAERLGLPHPYSYETALNVTDKVRMKDMMLKADIPTSAYIIVSDPEAVKTAGLKYPLMIKPADSNSANGVHKAVDDAELSSYFAEAIKFSRNGKVVVEEFVGGKEISAYCVAVNGEVNVVMTQERLSVLDDPVCGGVKCFGSIAPARLSSTARSNVKLIADKIAAAFNLANTPLFFQGKVNGDDVSVIEFAARVGGGVSSRTICRGTGFDIIEAAIDSFLGRKLSLEGWRPLSRWYAVNQIYGLSGIFDQVTGIEELLDRHIVDKVDFYRAKGSEVDGGRASGGRVGVMHFSAENESDLRVRVREAFQSIDCLNNKGKSMLRRDLNIDNLWDAS